MRSISHLPEDKHLEEEEDDKQKLRWSGGVRAFSHLTEPASSQHEEEQSQTNEHRPSLADLYDRTDRLYQPPGTFTTDNLVDGHDDKGAQDNEPSENAFYTPMGEQSPRPRGEAPEIQDLLLSHGDEPEVRDLMHRTEVQSAQSGVRSGGLFQGPVNQQDLHEFLQEHGNQPEIRQLLLRHGNDSAVQDLLHRTQDTDTEDMTHATGDQPVLLAAQGKSHTQASPGQQQQRQLASPPAPGGGAQNSSAPQARAEGQLPTPQNYAEEQKKSKTESAPKSPAAKGNPSRREYTELEKKELFTEDGRPRKPIGQLGITASSNIKDPNRTNSGRKPSTICLYDGKEDRQCTDKSCVANATSLRLAAGNYASDGSWMIDISNPEWRKQLKAIQSKEESSGRYIDRIMIFDHGGSARQEFGGQKSKLDPNSEDWKTISSSVRPRGHIVLVGCEVAKDDWDYTPPHPEGQNRRLMTDGAAYLRDLYIGADSGRSPTIHAYDENVRHREGRFQHSVTAGREHTYGLDGYKVE